MPLKPILDRERESHLVLLAKQGEEAAWLELAQFFQPLIDSVVRKNTPGFWNPETVDDLKSEAKLGFAQAVREFNPGRNRRLATLIHLIARRHVVDYIRRATRPTQTEEKLGREEVMLRITEAVHPEQESEPETQAARFALMEESLRTLAPFRRFLVDKLVGERVRPAEVAADIRMPVETLKAELIQALKELRRSVA